MVAWAIVRNRKPKIQPRVRYNISHTSAFKMKNTPSMLKFGQIMFYLGLVRGKSITVFLSFGGQLLTQSNVTKFLGVYLDEHLTWKYHINFVCKQMAKSVGILSRTRFYLSCKTKLMLYYTLLYPYITYCNSTWSST